MKASLSHRRGIPFFYDKTELEFQKDVYESYDMMVRRQSALHLADQLWGGYPMQGVFDFAAQHYPKAQVQNILELGAGVGRWIATLAQDYPLSTCWGIDYSYQMLKRAHEFWVLGKDIQIDLRHKGFAQTLDLKGMQLSNLNFGLAKASQLPCFNNSQDLVLSSFLLDRLDEPMAAFAEIYRVLKPGGKLIMLTPLNFNQAKHWAELYPPQKLRKLLTKMGFKILDWEENLPIAEPLDFRGNLIQWNCLGLVVSKTEEP